MLLPFRNDRMSRQELFKSSWPSKFVLFLVNEFAIIGANEKRTRGKGRRGQPTVPATWRRARQSLLRAGPTAAGLPLSLHPSRWSVRTHSPWPFIMAHLRGECPSLPGLSLSALPEIYRKTVVTASYLSCEPNKHLKRKPWVDLWTFSYEPLGDFMLSINCSGNESRTITVSRRVVDPRWDVRLIPSL